MPWPHCSPAGPHSPTAKICTNQKSRYLLKIITWKKRLLLTATFLALLATNILTLTSTAFNAALSGLMGAALGVRTVSSTMQSKIAFQDTTVKKHKATALKRKAATIHLLNG
jgi:membrane associated rhomboid family serine protease